MKIKEGFILREIAGSWIVVPVGSCSADFNGMITLNETGAFLWKVFQEETTEEQAVQQLLKEYNCDEATAKTGVEKIVKVMRESGFIE